MTAAVPCAPATTLLSVQGTGLSSWYDDEDAVPADRALELIFDMVRVEACQNLRFDRWTMSEWRGSSEEVNRLEDAEITKERWGGDER